MQYPAPGTYNPFYRFYFDLVPEGDIMDIFTRQKDEFIAFLESIPEDKYDYSYGPGKWTLKQAVLHISDTERVYAFRSLVAGRMDSRTELTSFDENEYARHADASERSMQDLIDEFRAVRDASIWLFRFMTEEQSSFQANNGKYKFTANGGILFMIGHVIHHVNVIKERYLGMTP
ncbi:MAG: DinB family protein [Saprospiraceae bacterium]|nr:DinB family protein [Saprospiraceae bacterium]